MKTTVLIVTFQSEGTILPCLQSIFASDTRMEVVVVDNASTDRTVERVRREYPQVRLLANDRNIGFSAAVNQAAQGASGDYLLLLNPDTLLSLNSLPRMVAALVRNPQLAAVGPLSNNAAALQSARHWLPDPQLASHPDQREKVSLILLQKFGGRVVPSQLLTGFALLVRRSVFEELGGLDPQLVLGLDDLDLCWRLSHAGHFVGVALDAFVYHELHKSFDAGVPEVVQRMQRASLEAFSAKLVRHYGRLEEIPSSQQLWGVDWFQPVEPSEESMAALTPEAPLAPTAVVVLVHAHNPSPRDACRFTLEACWEAGILPADCLVLDMSGQSRSGMEGKALVWSVLPGLCWADFAERVLPWFGSRRLLVLEAGCFLHPRLMGAHDNAFGPLGGSETPHSPLAPQASAAVQDWRGAWLLCLLQAGAQWPVSFEWLPACIAQSLPLRQVLEEKSLQILAQPKQAPVPPLEQVLPVQLLSKLEGYARCGIMGHGQVLDLRNQWIPLQECEVLVWRVHPLELSCMCLMLEELRQHALRKLVLLFDNAFYQDPAGIEGTQGVSPLDVRREVLQGGYRIDSVEAWQDAPQVAFSRQYASLELLMEPLAGEQLQGSAARLLLSATPCSSQYHLQHKVSIVLLAFGQLEFTRKCLESIQDNCRQNLELVLVDNGSTDGTEAYFRSIPGAVVIRNETNLGVAAGWNQGMRAATGDYILILNNDTIVGPQCIENLVRCAVNHPDAGMVAPRSNRIGGPQQVDGFTYANEAEIPQLALRIQKENELSCWEASRIKGFCMLMPRVVVEQIGVFDEQFGIGNLEDDDYCCRMRAQGFTLLVADDSFLFHYGSVSFQGAGIDRDALIRENMRRFEAKWCATSIAGKVAPVEGQLREAKSLLTRGDSNAAMVQLADILQRDPTAGAYLEMGRCLLAEKRSKEAFAMLCRALELDGSLEAAACEIVALLADGFEAESASDVLQFLRRKYPAIRSWGPEPGAYAQASTLWTERVEAWIQAGQFSEAMATLLDVLQREGESFECCNLLGIVKYQQGIVDEAIRWFEKALRYNPTDTDALMNYYDSALRLGVPQQAERLLESALRLSPELGEVRLALQEIRSQGRVGLQADEVIRSRELNIVAENLIREGLPEKATEVLGQILQSQPQNYRALNNMGLIEWYHKRMEVAYEFFAKAVEVNPWYVDAVVNLYDCAFLANRLEDFLPWLDKALQANPEVPELVRIQADLAEGRTPERLQVYFRKDGEQARLREQIEAGHKLLEEQHTDSAILLFSDLLKDYPDNLDCLNGLGIAAFYKEHYEDAYGLFRHALQLSPLDSDSLVNYWDAAQKLDRVAEAKAVLQNALSIDPTLRAVAEILENL